MHRFWKLVFHLSSDELFLFAALIWCIYVNKKEDCFLNLEFSNYVSSMRIYFYSGWLNVEFGFTSMLTPFECSDPERKEFSSPLCRPCFLILFRQSFLKIENCGFLIFQIREYRSSFVYITYSPDVQGKDIQFM